VLISAAFTAFAFVLVPFLRLGHKPQGVPVGMRERLEPPGPGVR